LRVCRIQVLIGRVLQGLDQEPRRSREITHLRSDAYIPIDIVLEH